MAIRKLTIVCGILLSWAVFGKAIAADRVDCRALASKIAQNRDIADFRPPLEGKVIGKGRVHFHDAPNAACVRKTFLIPGDMATVHQTMPGWVRVVYISAKDGEEHGGWLKENRVELKGQLGRPEQVPLPKDVTAYIERRNQCEHFIGEEPYDEARRKYLTKVIRETCTGSNRDLAALRRKYRDRPEVLEALAEFYNLAE
ncbi:MAG TPA: hypothetical protein VJ806_07105 [Luteimonas sp.]|nr:hypothetical protein [Luteimonas sp.]